MKLHCRQGVTELFFRSHTRMTRCKLLNQPCYERYKLKKCFADGDICAQNAMNMPCRSLCDIETLTRKQSE